MSTPPNGIDVEWQVTLADDVLAVTFDTEENARRYWLENQPSLLTRTTSEHWITDEVAAGLAILEPPTPAQEG